ncbi:hypothetical protein ACFWMU_31245 [Streptomyces sp. NPDC058357]|uniref:hypothetical protein n=1 Tax=unclassified Streptomyces TaxID=2593676 RepID=UPI00364D28A9
MKAAVVNLRYQGIAIAAGLCRALAGMPLPTVADGRIVLAADVSPWLRRRRQCLC